MKRLLLSRPLTGLITPLSQRTVLNFTGIGNGKQQRFLAMKTKTSGRTRSTSPSDSSTKGATAKRAHSATPKRKSVKSAEPKRRTRSVSAARKEQDAEKKAAKREKEKERRERKKEQENAKKEARALRKMEKRERKAIKKEEEKEKKALRRESLRERRLEKKEAEKVKAQARRLKEKARAKYRKRPPGSPVMPRNPRALFVKEKMSSAAGTTMPEKMKTVAAMYNAMTPEQKKPYEDAAAQDKVRYQKEFAAWREVNPEAPKRPKSGYLYYFSEQHALLKSDPANTGKKGTLNVAKIVGEKWKNLGEAEKKPYLAKAAQDSKRYESEKAAWSRKMGQ